MEPEEIDKLFRDKLAGRSVLPSADAWMRLQQKMEPPKKQRSMWVYYAAASVVVLLAAGILYWNSGGISTGPSVATVSREVAPPVKQTLPAAPETRSAAVQQRQESLAQAPVIKAPTTTGQARKSPGSTRRVLPAKQLPAPVIAHQPAPIQDPAPQSVPEVQPRAAGQPAQASASPDLSVVEVVVQRDAAAGTAEDPGLREQISRKGQLLKNIYKQARNLKNGEPVELATLGVDKSRIQEETKELKQKLTNVISL